MVRSMDHSESRISAQPLRNLDRTIFPHARGVGNTESWVTKGTLSADAYTHIELERTIVLCKISMVPVALATPFIRNNPQ